ncbi:MAG: glycine--tRNA ligase subunit beta, partial [Polyangiaceae bacterium]|nr:glycine--tRNA ligase subunit beta [Polyangiaceae bacterium]
EKVDRVELLASSIGKMAGQPSSVLEVAREGARLAKCDLVALMVGEFPELQGEMGAAYAIEQKIAPAVAEVIRDHYRPKGADDATATSPAAALVAIADRLDSLVGCFSIGLSPTGSADPFGLRRATLGILRTITGRFGPSGARRLPREEGRPRRERSRGEGDGLRGRATSRSLGREVPGRRRARLPGRRSREAARCPHARRCARRHR